MVPPATIGTVAHRAVADPLDHDHVVDAGGLRHGHVDVGLEGHRRPPPPAAVGGDDHRGLGVEDPVPQGVGREPPEDHRVDGPERVQASMATASSGIIGM